MIGSAFQSTTKVPSPRLGPPPPAIFDGSGLLSQRAKDTLQQLKKFLREEVFPYEKEIQTAGYEGDQRWHHHPRLDELKLKAKSLGLWNLFLPKETDQGKYGAGFTNLEYALMAEVIHRHHHLICLLGNWTYSYRPRGIQLQVSCAFSMCFSI